MQGILPVFPPDFAPRVLLGLVPAGDGCLLHDDANDDKAPKMDKKNYRDDGIRGKEVRMSISVSCNLAPVCSFPTTVRFCQSTVRQLLFSSMLVLLVVVGQRQMNRSCVCTVPLLQTLYPFSVAQAGAGIANLLYNRQCTLHHWCTSAPVQNPLQPVQSFSATEPPPGGGGGLVHLREQGGRVCGLFPAPTDQLYSLNPGKHVAAPISWY